MLMQIVNRQKVALIFAAFLCLQAAACGGWENDVSSWPKNDLPSAQNRASSPPLTTETKQAFPETVQTPSSLERQWIVNAAEAKQLIERGATLLDARGGGLITRRLQGAIAVSWEQFSSPDSVARGRLLDDDAQLTQQLQALGISAQRPVVVFGNASGGWGEDGRIVWMLRTLGHAQTVMVDGGFQALVEANISLQHGASPAPQPGDFIVQRDRAWEIQRDDLRHQLGTRDLAIIDAREPREFAGATPYGERRGGHIPGAVNLYFKDFLGDDGKLLARPKLLAKLRQAGITPDTPVVVYCTAGVRSGWLTAVLAHQGFQVQNYAGSMWEWSAAPADRYPLEIRVPKQAGSQSLH